MDPSDQSLCVSLLGLNECLVGGSNISNIVSDVGLSEFLVEIKNNLDNTGKQVKILKESIYYKDLFWSH